MHPAHRHPFYDELSDAADAEEFAALLLEDRGSPAFLPLLERTLHVLTPVESRATLLGNVEDVQVPARHAALMRRLITVIKARVNEDVRLELSQSLIDRTLIFYYGYYCEPWNLIGSLYATEVMGRNRLMRMEAGLERLGFDPADLEFIRAQMVSDEDHARDWMEGVIAPSVRANPALRTPIAEGIAACLGTSARHLDDLLRRATRRRWEDRSIFRPWQHLQTGQVLQAGGASQCLRSRTTQSLAHT
jgi:hypothetical protein